MLIVHDYMEHTDGGSRLCLELARSLPADLLCGFVRQGHPFWEGKLPALHTLMPHVKVQIVRQWLLALAFAHGPAAQRALSGKQGAIFSGSYAPLAVRVACRNRAEEFFLPRFVRAIHELLEYP